MQINRWALALCATVLFCAAPVQAATGQFTPGDILVSDYGANHVLQFNSSGTLLQTYPGIQNETLGSALFNGKLFVANRISNSSMYTGKIGVFSPNGTLTSSFSIPQIEYADDLVAFPDGVLAVTDTSGAGVQEYTQSGAFVRTIPISGGFTTGEAVTSADGSLWVASETSQVMYHFTEAGSLLGSFSTPFEPRTVQVARDGTLWMGNLNGSDVYHYNAAGNLLSDFATSVNPAEAIGLSADGSSIYVTTENATTISHYSTSGQSLGSFTVPGAKTLEYITVVTPEPACLPLLAAAAGMIPRRRTRIF